MMSVMHHIAIQSMKTSRKPTLRSLASIPSRVVRFYVEGFRDMSGTGRSLWALIIVKLILFFAVMKLFFFPDILKRDYPDDASRAEAVRSSLLDDRRSSP